jgi:ribonuclease HII
LVEIGPCALHRRSFAPVRLVDPDAVVEDAASAELLFEDADLEVAGLEDAEWA